MHAVQRVTRSIDSKCQGAEDPHRTRTFTVDASPP